jgi:hypothetical protein
MLDPRLTLEEKNYLLSNSRADDHLTALLLQQSSVDLAKKMTKLTKKKDGSNNAEFSNTKRRPSAEMPN